MEYRAFEIKLHSADNLKDINFFSKMRLYAMVSIVGNSHSRQETPVAKIHGTRFAWDFSMRFYVEDWMLQENRLTVVIQLRCKQTLGGDKDVGEVYVPLKELFDNAHDDDDDDDHKPKNVVYQVIRPSGKPRGVLHFSYSFGKIILGRVTSKKIDDHAIVPYKMASTVPYPPPSAPYLPLD